LSPGTYTSSVHIQGPINSVDFTEQFIIKVGGPPILAISPSSVSFTIEAGQYGGMQPVLVNTFPSSLVTVAASDSWIKALAIGFSISIAVDATNLAPGTYTGTITATPAASAPVQSTPATVSVTAIVLAPPKQITVSPSSLALTTSVSSSATATLSVSSSPEPAIYAINVATSSPLLNLRFDGTSPSPSTMIKITASAATPGTYSASVVFSWTGGSATIPITVYVTSDATQPPVITAVTGSGSNIAGALAPGELISIYGIGLGGAPTSFALDANGKVPTTLAGTQVLIDGIASPVLFTSTGQINAIVPYEIASGSATIQVKYTDVPSNTWKIPVASAAPSIFTVNGSGVGAGSIVNADGSVNDSTHPASRGSVIQIYATGGGQTNPLSSTGAVAASAANLSLPVTVSIGGVNAQVLYAGSAPGEADGVVQINAVVSATAPQGSNVPLVVTIGAVASQTVTIAVQ
jgi:uncharacterized protein (TIGR03437 family)